MRVLTKLLAATCLMGAATASLDAKTLVVYYSYTNNVERIVNELKTQIECDVIEIEPAEKGLDYAANNYAIGSAQIAAIRNNPADASSYPAIDPVDVNPAEYDTIIIGAPLWWSQMAAPLQTYLFHNGKSMAGKNIGLIVSSHSSGISGVVADAKRLIPDGEFLEPALWVRSAETATCASKIAQWLMDIDFHSLSSSIEAIATDGEAISYTIRSGHLYVNGTYSHLSLFNMSGAKVAQTSTPTINVASLPTGLYILCVSNGGFNKSYKIQLI